MLVSLFFLILIRFGASISVCDDLDIYFLIDTDSLIHNHAGVASVVEAIIADGSSEDAAFSLLIYGTAVSDSQLASQLTLLDTHDTFRANKSSTILQRLRQMHDGANTGTFRDISLADAFTAATQQVQPQRKYLKRKRFHKAGFKEHGFGEADDEDRFFIFDHFNKLTQTDTANTATNAELCELFEYIGEHSDQSIHFIMGQEYKNMKDQFDALCDRQYSHLFDDDLFFYLNKTSDNYDNEFDDHLENLERIFHLSCPAHIRLDDGGGSLHLTAHNQWIEPDTIRKCVLQYGYDGDADKLDPDHSFIYVDDHMYDHNTFTIGDHLIADSGTWDEIQPLGCSAPIYNIVNIKPVKTAKNNINRQILKLYVKLPESVQDYMLMADFNIDKPGFSESSKKYDIYTRDTSQANHEEYYMEEAEAENPEQDYRGYENKRRMADIYDKYLYEMDKDGIPKHVRKSTVHFAPEHDIVHEPLLPKKPPVIRAKSRRSVGRRAAHKVHKRTKSAAKSMTHVLKKGASSVGRSLGKLVSWITNKKEKPPQITPEFAGSFVEKEFTDEAEAQGSADDPGFDEPAAATRDLFQKEFKADVDVPGEIIAATKSWGPITLEVNGQVTFSAKAILKLNLDFEGKFHWLHLFKKSDPGKATFDLKLIGTVDATANFHLNAKASAKVTGKFPEISQGFWIAAGPVPIYFRPYVGLSLSLEITPLEFDFTVDAKYKQVITWSYLYYRKRVARSDDYTKDPAAPEVNNGFTVTKARPTKDFDVTMSLSNGNGDACKVELGVTLAIKPEVGLEVYWALGVKAEFELSAPIVFTVEIPRAEPLCKNDKAAVCGDTTPRGDMTALPSWKLDLAVKVSAYVKMPNFLKIIKQAYVLKKIVQGVVADLLAIATTVDNINIRTHLQQIQTGLTKMKSGEAREGLGDVLKGMLAIRKMAKGLERGYTSNKARIDKRMGQIEEFYNAMAEIIGNPLGITHAAVDHTFGWPIIGELTHPDKCVTIPGASAIARLIREGCCPRLFDARFEQFDDWYYGGYDAYNEYGGDRAVVPVVRRPPSLSNNPLLALMLLDIFTIFLILICMAGCMCVACGAFVFYNYNKTVKQEYAELNVVADNEQI